MKRFLRILFRQIFRFYPVEYGKYTILQKYFYPYLLSNDNIHTIRIANKFKMELDVSEYIQSLLFLFNSFEPETILLFEKLITPNQYIFDVGANIGYLSLHFSNLTGPKGQVFSFEPEMKNFGKLEQNIQINQLSNIKTFKIALSNINSTLKLYHSSDNNLGSHSLMHSDLLSNTFEEVPAIRFDDFVKSNDISKIDVIKIDVEGAETEVIEGMYDSIIQFKPNLIIELNDRVQRSRNSTADLLKEYICNTFGYICYKISSKGLLLEYEPVSLNAIENAVFVHKTKISSIKHLTS